MAGLRWAGAATALAAALGCDPARGPSPAAGSTLTIAVRADVTGFFPNPPILNEGYTMDVNWNLFEGLVRYDSRFRIEPAVALRWENPDERSYVFDLRPGLRFSDGRSVTAEDVAASLTAPRERRWVTRDYLQAIESVRILAPNRIEVRTRFPYLILLSKLPWGHVLPASETVSADARVVGTGPYRLESWSPGREFVFARNEHYRGPAPSFARARFVVVPDGRDRVERLLSADAHVADQVPLDAIERLRASGGVTVRAGPGIRVLLLALRVDRPPFADPRVREALDVAIDRAELNRRVFQGRAAPASQVVPQNIVGFNPELRVTPPDPARARALLAEAGYPKGLELRLDGPSNRYVRDVEVLAELKRQLDGAGFLVRLNVLEKGAFFALVDSGRSDVGLIGWACATGEAGDALDGFLHSRQADVLGSDNTMGFADAELDRLIDAANAATTQQDRTPLLQAALARVASLRPVVPIVVQPEALAISTRVAWDPPPNYALRLQDMRPAPGGDEGRVSAAR